MKIRITARHQKMSPKVKAYIEEKLEKLDRYHDHIIDCEVIVDKEKLKEVVEVNVKVFGKTINVKAKDADVTKATDLAMDKLEAQIKKFNDKIKDKKKKSVKKMPIMDEDEE